MTSFVHVEQPTQHPGVVRAERAVESIQHAVQNFDSARGGATLLLAAIVSALLVVANQVIDTWSDGHLMAAWIVMWTVTFAGLALFATPAKLAARSLRTAVRNWNEARRQAAEDDKMWQVALTDARVMADIGRTMNMSVRAQRLMRSYY